MTQVINILFHEIEWWYEYNDDLEDIEYLPVPEQEHIKKMITEGCHSGELIYCDKNENTYYGWWRIKNKGN